MIETYLRRREDDLAVLHNSLQKRSVDAFNRIGHQLAGNARNFGFPELEGLGFKMENLKPSQLDQAGPALLNEYKQWVDSKKTKQPKQTDH